MTWLLALLAGVVIGYIFGRLANASEAEVLRLAHERAERRAASLEMVADWYRHAAERRLAGGESER